MYFKWSSIILLCGDTMEAFLFVSRIRWEYLLSPINFGFFLGILTNAIWKEGKKYTNTNTVKEKSKFLPMTQISFSFFWILFIFLYSGSLLVINFIHISVYMSNPIAQFITPPPPPPAVFLPWCPYVSSLHLCLYFCPANRFICTIFLGSTYMR